MLSLLGSILFSCDFNPYYSSCRNGYYYSSDKDYGVDDICYEYAKNPDKDTIIAFHDTLGNIVNDTINTYYTATLVIGRHVERFEYNDSVLVVKQKPKDKFYEEDTLYYLDEYNRFKAFDYHEYWIIKTNTNDVYGPLSLNQYHNYCVKLGMPEKFRVLFDDGGTDVSYSDRKHIFRRYSLDSWFSNFLDTSDYHLLANSCTLYCDKEV